jgi:hypothetical protein
MNIGDAGWNNQLRDYDMFITDPDRNGRDRQVAKCPEFVLSA